ncbi:MAG TPA: glycosyltransferase family 2 protein [Kiritimatiellia bacterium]|nr:glycosyltransferase family 2 protein [Kiritimatiellia bacterium]HMO97748.1 glycosyltransferase family 2 protein [Kiritimatiellia bacterium]HMP95387.1 glycosyltransferase family 2 protein [Kiritimatiellia bacterium]
MKLSIVIPAYNEEKRIRRMLDAYLDYFLPRYNNTIELIIVVNGSLDATAAIARTYSDRHAQVSMVEEKDAIGKGGAIILGFKHAAGELIGFADADGSTPPEAFDDLARNIGDAGAIIASRWFPESVVEPRQPLKRRIASRIFNFCVRNLFGMAIHDTQCGAKVLRREAVQAILPHLGITRWAFDVDLLFQVHRAGYRIIEWPTVWHDEGGSQLRIVRASIEMFVAITRLRLIYSPLRWVVTVYDRTLGRVLHRA